MEFGIGQPVRRREDFRLLTGAGRYSDDVNLPGQAYAVILRSPHGHARIRGIDAAAARAVPGVIAVLTGAEAAADGLRALEIRSNPADVPLKNRDGRPIFAPLYGMIAGAKVRRVGEVVAAVVAETEDAARDAAERIAVDYEPLAAVTDARRAAEPGAPAVWDELPSNLPVDDEQGDAAATDAAFARAAHVVEIELANNRIVSAFMEPRAATAEYDAANGRITLYAGNQSANRVQQALARVLGMPEAQVRVISGDVGGGFGTRGGLYPEFALVAWAAKRLGRPVKWRAERWEAFVSDNQARDLHTRASLALDADGRFLALRCDNAANLGCHAISLTPLARGVSVTTGVYAIPHVHVRSRAMYTNCVPIGTFRGAGRPEAMFLLERLIDKAARATGIDPVALRRRNLIPASAMPYRNPLGMRYDSGDFAKNMEMALHLSDWKGFPARRAAAKSRGRLAGIGLANYIETATGQPVEWTELEILPEGRVEVRIGTQDSGQGHDTSFSQLLVEWLGVPFDRVRVTEGDTDLIPKGSGSHSSRSMKVAGVLIGRAKDRIIDKGKRIAAQVLEAALEDIEFAGARFRVAGTDRAISLFEAAQAARDNASLPAELRGRLADAQDTNQQIVAFPNGCHVCEVEVDPETGAVAIVRFTAIDDVGRVINPLLVDGQTHGGIAHGVGQALYENCVYSDDAGGQLLSGSLMDYCLPKADGLPSFACENNENLSMSNPLGIKGAGEGGATGAPPAVINAVVDALAEFGVTHVEMPATPERVWRAIAGARAKR